MRKETKKVPTIRFRGFTDDWEQRKLGDCFAERRENMPDGELLSVTINDGIKKFSELGRHDNSNDDKSKYKRVCIGDIAYNSMRMWQGASGYSIYEGIVSPAYTVLKSKSNINSRFASYLFKCQEMMYTFQVNSQGITSDNWNLKFPALSQIKVKLPCQIYEQKKVADYLSNLDGFVVLHQRKLDQLKKLKKYFLQNMFPAKGEKVPKIRLKGFTSDWEQHNLGEITSKIGSGKTPSGGAKAYVNQGTILIRSQNVHDDMVDFSDVVFIDDETNKSMKNSIVVINDILLNITGASIGRSAVYKSMKSANVNQHVCIIRPISGYYSDFIQLYISSENGQKQIDLSQAGGGREGLNFQQISKFEFAFPSYDEQVKIGEYFRYTNDLIACNQHKIAKLRTLKKYMLQNMFI